MNQARKEELRLVLMGRIRHAIRPDGPVDAERQQAAVEALCVAAGAVFSAQYRMPNDPDLIRDLGSAAIGGMLARLKDWEGRN